MATDLECSLHYDSSFGNTDDLVRCVLLMDLDECVVVDE